ncbi:MAG: adenylate/guanylate cyclase, partial [Pedosphaera sp.]|nr:adenylate/guanylate cyclase [Pedosphaera sp.]
ELDRLTREFQQPIPPADRKDSEAPRPKNFHEQPATRVRFRCRHQGGEKIREVNATEFLIGRGNRGKGATIDLADDLRVSRRHARVWSEGGHFWIEDLGSKFGTRLDGVEIKGAGRRLLAPLSKVIIGDTTLILMEDAATRVPSQPLAAPEAPLAVANQQVQDDFRQSAILYERLLTKFSPQLRNRLVSRAREGRLRPGGERSEVTILSADLLGFTAATANRNAGEVMELLNDYLPAFAQAVFKHEGTIDKFTGDGLLAVFGSPEPDPEQHRHALLAACEMQAIATAVTGRRTKSETMSCGLGIGLHSGQVLHGFLGGADMLEFTVIGDAVNLAGRLCSMAPPGAVLLSPQIFQHVFQYVRAEPVVVETKHEGKLKAYRVLELKHTA